MSAATRPGIPARPDIPAHLLIPGILLPPAAPEVTITVLEAEEPAMGGKIKAALKAAGGFAWAHKSEIATGVAYLASLPAPAPFHQALALVAVVAAALAGTKYGGPIGWTPK